MYTVKVTNAKENKNGLAKGSWMTHEWETESDAEKWKLDMENLHPEVKCTVIKVED